MTKVTPVTRMLNLLLILILALAVVGFLSFGNAYGAFWAIVTFIIGFGVYRQKRWGYFASAAWALACYQLAKQEYEFEAIKRWVMIVGFMVIILAVYLHEKLGRAPSPQEQSTDDQG